jgi:NAD(P)-dependent dehydrogenase (short-subunit alcohol dehydrogenase family)
LKSKVKQQTTADFYCSGSGADVNRTSGDHILELSGKRALVTGAGKRVGRAIALKLAEMGADLIIHYNTSSREADEVAAEVLTMGRKVDTIRGDLSNPADIEAIEKELERHGLDIDILINSAAVYFPTPLADVTIDTWDCIMNVNLRAPFLLCRAFGLKMKERGHGCIINIADCNVRRPYREFTPYLASKAGLVMITETLALELAPEVRVNAVAPGTVLPPEDADTEFKTQSVNRSPLKVPGTPEDVAMMVGYLAANAGFITGTTITVDGGATIR